VRWSWSNVLWLLFLIWGIRMVVVLFSGLLAELVNPSS
jgi:hypothetical protein